MGQKTQSGSSNNFPDSLDFDDVKDDELYYKVAGESSVGSSDGNTLKEKMADKTQKTTIRRFVQKTLGYPLEKHVYSTDDGYLNTVYRIPGKQGTNPPLTAKDPEKRVVIY